MFQTHCKPNISSGNIQKSFSSQIGSRSFGRGRWRTRIGSQKLNRTGAAAVEFAIVAPVFILLIIGFIELGRAMMVQQILTNASRVGARQATLLNSTEQGVIDTVSNYVDTVSVPSATINVSPSPATASAGDLMTVTVSIPFDHVSWLPSPWFLGGSTLTASSVMRKEGFD